MGIEKDYDLLVKRIAANIRHTRGKRELTQEAMADHGFNYRFYQRIESGKHSVNLYTLYKLSRAFRVPIKDFFR